MSEFPLFILIIIVIGIVAASFTTGNAPSECIKMGGVETLNGLGSGTCVFKNGNCPIRNNGRVDCPTANKPEQEVN